MPRDIRAQAERRAAKEAQSYVKGDAQTSRRRFTWNANRPLFHVKRHLPHVEERKSPGWAKRGPPTGALASHDVAAISFALPKSDVTDAPAEIQAITPG
jgi:hypothetical protein